MTSSRRNPWAVLAVLCLGYFLTVLDMTIVNIAIPDLLDDLDASLDDALWVINAYTLCLAVLVISAGRVGDLRGPRAVFVAGVAVFTVASALCGIAADPGALIAARVLQGVGAALLVPQTLTIITGVFPPELRGAAFGVTGIATGLAGIAGPTVGGVLVSLLDWRWIFFVNVPIGVAVIALALTIVPEQRHGGRRGLDGPGVALASAALFCLTFGLVEGERYGWGQVWTFVSIPALLAAGVALGAAFVVAQVRRQDRDPLLPFALFRDRNFALMNVVAAVIGFALVGVSLVATVYMQSVLDLSALQAGLLLAPVSLASALAAPVAGRLADQGSARSVLAVGMVLYATGMAGFAVAAAANGHWPALLPGLVVAGFGIGCSFAPMGSLAMHDVEAEIAGAASGVLNTTRQLGAALGGAVVGAVLQIGLAGALREQAVARAGELPEVMRGPFVAQLEQLPSHGFEADAGQPDQLRLLLSEVYERAFGSALQPAMAACVATVALGALCCLWVRRPAPAPAGRGVTSG